MEMTLDKYFPLSCCSTHFRFFLMRQQFYPFYKNSSNYYFLFQLMYFNKQIIWNWLEISVMCHLHFILFPNMFRTTGPHNNNIATVRAGQIINIYSVLHISSVIGISVVGSPTRIGPYLTSRMGLEKRNYIGVPGRYRYMCNDSWPSTGPPEPAYLTR